MLVSLVPTGVEGASYALFTTTWNAASVLSDALSTMLLRIWDVSKPTLANGDLDGLKSLTIATALIQTVPVLFIWMVPGSLEALQVMKADPANRSGSDQHHHDQHATNDLEHSHQSSPSAKQRHNSSELGGFVFISIVTLSVLYAIGVGIMNVLHPGWMGET